MVFFMKKFVNLNMKFKRKKILKIIFIVLGMTFFFLFTLHYFSLNQELKKLNEKIALQEKKSEILNVEKSELEEKEQKLKKKVSELKKIKKLKLKDGSYTGETQNGLRHGKGKFISDSGYILEGTWVNDELQGFGKRIIDSETKYVGNFKNSLFDGKGEFLLEGLVRVKGNFKGGELHGKTYIKYKSGTIFKGTFNNGKKNGICKYIYTDGSSVTVNFKMDVGKQILSNGDIYEGDIEEGKFYGQGTLKFANGDSYEGAWKNGKKHGWGILRKADGIKYEGDFKNDMFHGRGRYEHANGDLYEGDFKDDLMHGWGRYLSVDGNLYEGEFKNDKPHGEGIITNSDIRYNGNFFNGQFHGKGVLESIALGRLLDGNFINNKFVSGKRIDTFQNRVCYIGSFRTTESGETVYHGAGVLFFKNGDKIDGHFKDGLANGEALYTYANGKSEYMTYKNGEIIK